MEQIKMMPNGMPGQGQGMNTMQQPQPGNQHQQLYARIMHDLKNGLHEFQGSWQSTFDIAQRASRTMQLVTQLRQLEPNINKCLSTAQNFEVQTVRSSPNKEIYLQQIQKKLNDIHTRRQQNVANHNMLPQSQQMPQPMNINPANLNLGMNGNGNNMSNINNGFPMNAPMPNVNLQQLQQQNNDTMNPQNLMAPPMQQQNSQNADAQQTLMQNGMNMNPQPQLQPPNQQQIFALAQRWFHSMGDQKRQELRIQASRSMNDQQRQQAQAAGQDPAMHLLVNKAKNDLFRNHQTRMQMAQQGMSMGASQGMTGGNAQQNQAGIPSGQDFDFSSIMAKQASALEMQKSGEQVVPASNNANLPFVNPQQMNASNLQTGNNGINPAMLNANNGNAMSQPPANLSKEQQMGMQMIAMEKKRQEQQERLRIQSALQQQQQAHQQAAMHSQTNSLATPNALTGPAGGSPAMPMLNRPMQPPGGPPSGTPQQPNRGPNMNQTPQANQQNVQANNVNALLQQHQMMMSRNNTQGMPNSQASNAQQQRAPTNVVELMATLEPGAQAKLQQMPRDQMAAFLRAYAAQKYGQNPQNMRNGMPNMGSAQGQNGQVAMNGMANSMPQMGLQQQQVGQGHPQIPPGLTQAELQARMLQQQQHMQQQQHLRQQALQQQAAQQQMSEQQNAQQQGVNAAQMNQAEKQQRARYTAMMVRPFPQDVLAPQALNLSSVPPNVTTWGTLRGHLQQNAAVLQPGILQKFNQLMQSWFRSKPEELQLGLQQLQNAHNNVLQQHQGQGGMPQQGGAPSANGGQPGGAPTAQMVQPPQVSQVQRPTQQQQLQQPNMRPGQMQGQISGQIPMPPNKPITDAEVAIFRERFPPAQHWSVEQAKAAIDKRKREAWALKFQGSRNASASGPNAAQMQNRTQVGNAAHASGQQQVPQQQQQVPGKRPSPQVPQSAASDDVMEIPNPNAMPKATPKQQQYAFVPQPGKDVKPEDKDSVERRMATLRQVNQGFSDSAQTSTAQQMPTNTARPGAMKMPTQAQNDSLKALLAQATEAELANVKRLLAEGRRETQKGPAIKVSAAEFENAKQMLRSIYKPFQQVDTTFPFALKFPKFTPDRIKEIIRAKFQVFYNWEEATDDIKDYLSLSAQELASYRVMLMTYLNDMKILKAQAKAAGESLQRAQSQEHLQQQQQMQIPPAVAAAIKPPLGQTTPGVPPMPKHNRKASHNKAPAAPTEYKTFDFGSPNPHGVPKYDQSGNQLTPDKLKMPPSKRRKTGQPDSPATTPAAQVGTPASDGIKTSSPEAMRKMQQAAPMVAEPQRKWLCEHGDCPASIEGFESEDGLKGHVEAEHALIDDPMQFLLDSAAKSLGVDGDGNELPMRKPAANGARPIVPIKQEARTPNGLGIMAGTPQGATVNKATIKREPGNKTPAPIAAPERVKTLREVMAEKAGYTLPTPPVAAPLSTPSAPEPTSLWEDLAPALSPPAFLDDFDSLTAEDWHFHLNDLGKETGIPSSPETTPGSSSRASDVSINDRLRINFEWDAFGNGDTAVPEGLGAGLEGLGLDDGDAEGGDKEMLDWSSGEGANGPSWEELFPVEMVQ